MNQELPNSLREALARQAAGDAHPSSDVLTAFVEHSLPSRESQRITDHLAKCADCREVVFLASAAVEEPAGEEQELMPEDAVPRISPALQAKTDALPGRSVEATPLNHLAANGGGAGRGYRQCGRVTRLRASGSTLAIHQECAADLQQTIASKEPPSSATNSQPTSRCPASAESSAQPHRCRSLSRSLRLRTANPARTSGTFISVVASRAAGQLPSGLGERASLEPPSPPAPNAATLEYKPAPAAIPRQNSFVESEAQSPPTLA